MQILNPPGWPRPKGYSNGISASGRMVFVAGMVGWNENEEFESDDFVDQFRQACKNILAVLKEGHAGPEHMVRMTMYLKSKKEYLGRIREVGAAYREVFGKNFPVMAAVEITDLMEDRAQVEIEVTAVVPE